MSCKRPKNSGMKFPWININASGTSTAFRHSFQNMPSRAFLPIPMPEFLGLYAGEKNNLRDLWFDSPYLLRPENPKGPRSFLRRPADLSGIGNPPGSLSRVPDGEAGKAGLVGRSALLYQAFCLLRWAAVSRFESAGYRPGVAPELEDGQDPGDAVHAGAVAQSGNARARGDRN